MPCHSLKADSACLRLSCPASYGLSRVPSTFDARVFSYINDLDCKEEYTAFISTPCPSWPVFEKTVCSVRWLLLFCIVRENIASSQRFIACLPVAASCSLFYHEGPHAGWLAQLFTLADWGRYPEEVVWNHDGTFPIGRQWPEVCWYTLCFLTYASGEEPPQTLQGVLWAVPVSSLALAALAQQHRSLSTVVWQPALPESCFTSPFVGSGGTFPAIPHSTERPFRNSVCMGGMGWRERGGGLFKLPASKDLLPLSVVNIDLTYFCYNSI